MRDLRSVMRNFQIECKHEAIKLIENGIPPYDAIEKARDIVSKKRANQQINPTRNSLRQRD